ncbi:MAG: flagellar basal body L-ring protein FlgH, partial [Planctomycetota bacterium]|nr:flagellar basal body L-ring protein FlgH [Planctomycetota bacterium]
RVCASLLLLSCSVAPLAAQSLFTAETLADGTLYADEVARKIGDLITIRVVERIAIADEKGTETSRDNSASLSVNAVAGLNNSTVSSGGQNRNALPGFNLESSKEFKGEGSFDQTTSFEVTLTGRVIDVLENGNLVIEARRAIEHETDSKTVTLTGICRRTDIDSTNTVVSSKLHNFQVAIEGEGPLSRAQQEGWLGRLMDIIWPF